MKQEQPNGEVAVGAKPVADFDWGELDRRENASLGTSAFRAVPPGVGFTTEEYAEQHPRQGASMSRTNVRLRIRNMLKHGVIEQIGVRVVGDSVGRTYYVPVYDMVASEKP